MIQADYNNDGFVDVLVLRGGWLGKDGRYPAVAAAQQRRQHVHRRDRGGRACCGSIPRRPRCGSTTTATACSISSSATRSVPGSDAEDPCELFRNNGDGTFTECAAECGVRWSAGSKAVVCGDYNNDGRPDLYLSSWAAEHPVLRNDGPAGGDHRRKPPWRFTDVAAEAGVTEPMNSFSCWFLDYDNDGWPDLFVAGYVHQGCGGLLADYLGAPPTASARASITTTATAPLPTSRSRQAVHKLMHGMG